MNVDWLKWPCLVRRFECMIFSIHALTLAEPYQLDVLLLHDMVRLFSVNIEIVREYASTEALVDLRAPAPASNENAPPPAKKRKTPGDLLLSTAVRKLVRRLRRRHARRKNIRHARRRTTSSSTAPNRDLHEYLDLNDAMKTGDVGRMEYLLPQLLFRYPSGVNHKYAWENVELMQEVWREWLTEIKYVYHFRL